MSIFRKDAATVVKGPSTPHQIVPGEISPSFPNKIYFIPIFGQALTCSIFKETSSIKLKMLFSFPLPGIMQAAILHLFTQLRVLLRTDCNKTSQHERQNNGVCTYTCISSARHTAAKTDSVGIELITLTMSSFGGALGNGNDIFRIGIALKMR